MMSKPIHMYTDGACRGNPGPGGWGVLLQYGNDEKELCGGEKNTTNNRMELMAAIEGLKALKSGCCVIVTTDSQYVRQGITQWIHGWKRKNWCTASGAPVKNVDLWQELERQTTCHQIQWEWVKGHAGHPGNERADQLAREGIGQIK